MDDLDVMISGAVNEIVEKAVLAERKRCAAIARNRTKDDYPDIEEAGEAIAEEIERGE